MYVCVCVCVCVCARDCASAECVLRFDHNDVYSLLQFYVMMNGIGRMRDAMNTSIMLADARSASQATFIDQANMIVLLVSLLMITTLIAVVILPAINKVIKDKQLVFDALIGIPQALVKQLRADAQQQLQTFRREEEMFDDGAGLASQTDPVDLDDNKAMAPNTIVQIPHSAPAMVASKSSKKSNRKRQFVQRSNEWATLSVSLLWPLCAYMGFFIGLFCWVRSAVETSRFARSEVLWSKQVQFFTSMMNSQTRGIATICDSIPLLFEHIDGMWATAAFGAYIQDGLLVGNADRYFRPANEISPEIVQLYMQDGCINNDEILYNVDECKHTFENGLVGRGLQYGWQRLLELGRRDAAWYVWHSG
jgi:hypothetical protein